MKLTGRIKTIIFKGGRVSVLLEDAQVFTEDQKWMPYTDINLVKDGKYKKGETWLSSFKESIYQGCRELSKGAEVEVGVIVTERGFKNIDSIGLKLPEVDVLEEVPPDEPLPEEETHPLEKELAKKAEKWAMEEREKDSPEAQAEKLVESTTVDTPSKEVLIIRQTCIKAMGAMVNFKPVDKTTSDLIKIAQRLEKYVLEGK